MPKAFRNELLQLPMPTNQIEITINGESRHINDDLSLEQLIQQLQLVSQQVAIEVNRQLIPRREHAGHRLRSGDQLEVVSLAGGG